MNNIMRKKIFTIIAFTLALIFWFFDSSVHYFLYNEPQFELIPNEFNELWMRVIIVLLIIFFGIFADYFTNSIMYREKQLEVVHVYNGVLNTSGHVLNNLLNQMQLFKLEALKSKDFDREVIKYYDNAIKEASDLIDTLSRVEDITAGDLAASADLNNVSNSSNRSNPAEVKKPGR